MAQAIDIVNYSRAPANEMTATALQLRTITLLEEIARSQAVLNRRLDAVERLLTREEPVFYFPQFRQLPPEIRHRIWSLAIPVRILRPWKRDDKKKHRMPLMRPPAIAGACREARAIATMHGGFVSLTHDAADDSENPARTSRYWFDSRRDVLELDRRVDIEGDEPRGIKDLIRRARHVLASRAEAAWFTRLFRNAAHLERVSVKLDVVSVGPCTWDLGVVRQLFGDAGGTVVTMDVEDADEVARVKACLGEYWRSPVFCAFNLEAWARERETSAGGTAAGVRDAGWMRRLAGAWMSEVARGWVMAKAAEATSEGQLDMEGSEAEEALASAAAALDVEDGFVRATLVAMPEVKLVRAYYREATHEGCRP
ncbi:hypothetical protein CTA2_2306 [Colletotrichum tanaceti]|uniref:2EXR domain-containing protein n=1 Tax=Colletotrichum tanaceti TaxID=1306861 RepID=A0A4U6XSP8_9PEZI|nr:hypothetical protein CTA2_2306 [Colletotrichum tanaceti]TKW58861.1 hypothetical protein CTA1_8626 [Colletotrichum tanaceti]